MYVLISENTGLDEAELNTEDLCTAFYQALEHLGYRIVERDEDQPRNYELFDRTEESSELDDMHL